MIDTTATRLEFPSFAGRTIAAARNRFGTDSTELTATEDAWHTVGVRPQDSDPAS